MHDALVALAIVFCAVGLGLAIGHVVWRSR